LASIFDLARLKSEIERLQRASESPGVRGDFAPDKRKRVYYLSMTDLRTLSEMLQEARRRLKAIGEHL